MWNTISNKELSEAQFNAYSYLKCLDFVIRTEGPFKIGDRMKFDVIVFGCKLQTLKKLDFDCTIEPASLEELRLSFVITKGIENSNYRDNK